MPSSAGRAFYNKKIAEGKTPRSAARAPKRHLATHLGRVMLADENGAFEPYRENPSLPLDK
jgi:transposase